MYIRIFWAKHAINALNGKEEDPITHYKKVMISCTLY